MIEQILAARATAGQTLESFYFRTHDGHECDLLIKDGRRLEVIEIKLTTNPSPRDFAALARTALMPGATRQVLVSRTREPVARGPRWSVGLADYLEATR